MNKLRILASTAGCLLLAAGCTPDPTGTGDPGTTSDTGTSTTGDKPTTDATSSSSESGETPTDTGSTAAELIPDMPVADGQCDPWEQDCPTGFKCMAFAEETENHFTGTKCTPVVDDPGTIGDPCNVEGGWWSGIDDCDYGLACWDINHDNNTGKCVALCTGTPEAYDCPSDDDFCAFWVPGLAHVCLEKCDPLLQDCSVGQSCLPEWSSNAEQWVCAAEYSFDEGQAFDPCSYSNACDPGLICWDPAGAVECAGFEVGCCLPLCDLSAPQCNGQGAECTGFYGEIDGQAPPEFDNVGLCVVPGG